MASYFPVKDDLYILYQEISYKALKRRYLTIYIPQAYGPLVRNTYSLTARFSGYISPDL